MRILFDECVPRPLRRGIPGHDIRTVGDMGWAGKQNGELLALIVESGFAAFITVDRNLRYQQNLRAVGMVVVVLGAVSNRIEDLLPLLSSLNAALADAQPGQVIEIVR